MKIALAQTCPISAPPGSPHRGQLHVDSFSTLLANLTDVEENIRRAKSAGAHIVCFAEYFLQGILNDGRQYLSLPSRYLEARIADLARKYEIAVTGTIVHGSNDLLPPVPPIDPFAENRAAVSRSNLDAGDPTAWAGYLENNADILADPLHYTLLNEAFYIDDKGEKKGSYTKKNLWHPERQYLKPGIVDDPVFDTPWGKAGFLICWDLSHPAAAQNLADQGADLIFAPAYWLSTDSEPMLSRNAHDPDYELNLVQSLCSARSFETETILIHVNPGGPEGQGFMGGSGIWSPLIGRVGGCNGAEVGVEIVEVDLGVLPDARELYRIREDAALRNAT